MTLFILFLTSFLAATVVPLSSEVVFLLTLEEENVVAVLLAASLGNWLGGVLTYWMGWLAKWSWIEKYLKVKRSKIEKTKGALDQYGGWLGFLCWVPFVGDVIAIGLGVFRVTPFFTITAMFVGKFIRYLVLVYFFT